MTKEELNAQLLDVRLAKEVDYARAEELLWQGAEPLGKIEYDGYPNNLYSEIVSQFFYRDEIPEDFYNITELFLRYGMNISKPSIPYDDGDDYPNPLWVFGFPSKENEYVLHTLKLLLDHGLNADHAHECWLHAIFDICLIYDFSIPSELEAFYDYLRKLMLIASYPHVLCADAELRKEIWLEQNHYDLTRFRNWRDFSFEVDSSRCGSTPGASRSVVTIIEKSSGQKVWRFGINLRPEDL